MTNLEKLAYFRDIYTNTDSKNTDKNTDKNKFEQMYEQRRKNLAELRNYRPLSWATRIASFAPGFLPFIKSNKYLGIASGLLTSFLGGRIMDDITGRTKLKRELKYINDALDQYDSARQMFDDYNPAFQGSPWQTPRTGKY